MPENLLADRQLNAAAQALECEIQAVTKAVKETLHLPRLNELPESVIDLLAWQWHVDFYEPLGMDKETKIKLIKQSLAWHRIKGTPCAVENIVAAIFGGGTVKEWFDYGGKPYHFKVIVKTDKFLAAPKFDIARKSILQTKNVRSVLDTIECIIEPDFGSHEPDAGGNNTAVTKKYTAMAGKIMRTVILVPEIKYQAPKISAPLGIAGIVTIHKHTVPSIYKAFGRTKIIFAAQIHKTISSTFDIRGDKNEQL